MNKIYFSAITMLTLCCMLCTSCKAVAVIFKTGMGFGIFLVIGVIMLITYGVKLLMESRNN
jgi:hypothetical protein